MNALLLSLKGSPILYYGDEIGMGDDPFLGDRNGVRTPMQWSPDKNGGFSRAPHHRLFMPAISHGPFSFEFVNVEDAEKDPYSLLNFMKRLLGLRRQYVKVFGRGSFELVPVENPHVLVFLRVFEDKKIMVAANLSRFAQSFFLPVSDQYLDLVPVELFSHSPFPKFGDQPYHFQLGPHGFFWFALEPEEVVRRYRYGEVQVHPAAKEELPVLHAPEGLHNLLVRTMVQGQGMEQLEALLPAYVKQRRWYGAKERRIRQIRIEDAVRLKAQPHPIYFSLLEVATEADGDGTTDGAAGGTTDIYALPLTLSFDEEAARLLEEHPHAAVAWVDTPSGRGLLHDATVLPEFWLALFRWTQAESKSRSLKGVYSGSVDPEVRTANVASARLLTGEQSNSSAILDDRFYVKLYRRMERGVNPETELLEYLTSSGFKFIPRLYGSITFRTNVASYAMAVIQEALPVETDGWNYALEQVQHFLERVAEMTPPEDGLPHSYLDDVPGWLEDLGSEMVTLTRTLGIRTAELHMAFSQATGPMVAPEEGSPEDTDLLVDRVRREAEHTRALMADHAGQLPELPRAIDWERAYQRLDRLKQTEATRQKIRVHGDFHLGQVLIADGEIYILDFEGEPTRSLAERRQLDYALRDVAGMLRSLEYAALAAWQKQAADDPKLKAWTFQLVRWIQAVFLNAYFNIAENSDFILPRGIRRPFLWTYLFDKALYEVRYELSHRPEWVWLPLHGLVQLLEDPAWDELRPEPDAIER